jgi:hypothetical protein
MQTELQQFLKDLKKSHWQKPRQDKTR